MSCEIHPGKDKRLEEKGDRGSKIGTFLSPKLLEFRVSGKRRSSDETGVPTPVPQGCDD